MKALTIRQPYASLVALGVKTIITESWPTAHRGCIAIHAGARPPDREAIGVGDWCALQDRNLLLWELRHRRPDGGLDQNGWPQAMPLGAVVATANLVDCVPIVVNPWGSDPRVRDYGIHEPLPHHRDGLWFVGEDSANDRRIEDQRPYGLYEPGRWAWVLDDIRPLTNPVPARGRRGLWKWDPDGALFVDAADVMSS